MRRGTVPPTAVPAPENSATVAVHGLPEAPITLVEFSDFQCPFYAHAAPLIQQLMRQYPGKIRWVFKHFPLASHAEASLAHEAAAAAGAQGQFWQMHDLLFANRTALKRQHLIAYARRLGLNLERFVADLDHGTYRAVIEHDKAEGTRLGVRGTPTFLVNGRTLVGLPARATFESLIMDELRRVQAQDIPPVEDYSHGLSVHGPPQAPVTLAVFADFQSPLSAQAAGILRAVRARYPRHVRLIFKHFPLRFHPQAALAHEAALAAGAQGQFWPMHDLLLQHPQALQPTHFAAYAKRLGLDLRRFTHALDTHQYRDTVRQDRQDGMQRNVRGVPTFFLNHTRFDGLQTFAVLHKAIARELARQGATAKGTSRAAPRVGGSK